MTKLAVWKTVREAHLWLWRERRVFIILAIGPILATRLVDWSIFVAMPLDSVQCKIEFADWMGILVFQRSVFATDHMLHYLGGGPLAPPQFFVGRKF